MICKKNQSGTTLIEVLVTVTILSVALLAMALLQSQSLKLNQSALNRSQANILAYKMIEKMRMNTGSRGGNLNSYNMDYGDMELSGTDPRDEPLSTDPQAEMFVWVAELDDTLPQGEGKVECADSTSLCTVSIRWSEAHVFGENEDAEEGSESFSEFSYQTRL